MTKPNLIGIIITALCAIVFTLNSPAFAEPNPGEWTYQIEKVDRKAQRVAGQRKIVADEKDTLHSFAKTTTKWLAAVNRVNQQINALNSGQGHYARYTRNQKASEMAQLQQEKQKIEGLNGGQMIDGVWYTSLKQMQQALPRKAKDYDIANREHSQLTKDLIKLDKERDEYTKNLRTDQFILLRYNQEWLDVHKKNLKICQEFLNDNNLWCMPYDTHWKIPSVYPRELIIARITDLYINEINTPPKQKFNPAVLAGRITKARDDSDRVKRQVYGEVRKTIGEIEKKIARLEQRTSVKNPSGCWVLLVGTKKPVVTIKQTGQGSFSGYLSRTGSLRYFKPGEKLFTVKRTNYSTFDGTEFSYSNSGKPTRMTLRLMLSPDGRTMIYRSNQQVSMARCQQ